MIYDANIVQIFILKINLPSFFKKTAFLGKTLSSLHDFGAYLHKN